MGLSHFIIWLAPQIVLLATVRGIYRCGRARARGARTSAAAAASSRRRRPPPAPAPVCEVELARSDDAPVPHCAAASRPDGAPLQPYCTG
jgi:hypothetical protein